MRALYFFMTYRSETAVDGFGLRFLALIFLAMLAPPAFAGDEVCLENCGTKVSSRRASNWHHILCDQAHMSMTRGVERAFP